MNLFSMHLLNSIVVILVPLVTGSFIGKQNPKDTLTTETLVKKHGYRFRKYSVQTEDGYVLGLHRIGSYSNAPIPGQVAFMMHGLVSSSSDWIVVGRENSLAYILVEAGYDVWMGNARGNTYSRRHVEYNPDEPFNDKFWNFSWHEIGIFDLPAMINYIRYKTGVEQLRFFGHSQGATTFFVLTSLRPEYNRIIKSAHLLAPVVFLSNAENKFLRTLGPLPGNSVAIQKLLGWNEFRPSEELMKTLGNALCTDFSEDRVLCGNIIFLVNGFTNETVNNTIIPDLLASNPAGSSVNQALHFTQDFVSGHFRQYDHGLFGNWEAYGSPSPPDYPLENIDAPIFIYHSLGDNFSTPKDILKLCRKLRSLVGRSLNPIEKFDHVAYMYSYNLAEKVHKYVMRDVASIG